MSKVWSAPTTPDIAHRRVGGRRRYNSMRQLEAAFRRQDVANGLIRYGWVHGVQARLARELGVSQATISRDVAWLMYDLSACPTCDSPVTRQRWQDLERRRRGERGSRRSRQPEAKGGGIERGKVHHVRSGHRSTEIALGNVDPRPERTESLYVKDATHPDSSAVSS